MVFVDRRLTKRNGEKRQVFRRKILAITEDHMSVIMKKSINALLRKDDPMARHLPMNGLVAYISCQPWAHILGGLRRG